LPQAPQIHGSTSTNGMLALQVSTASSSNTASEDFKFLVRAQQHNLSEPLLFTFHDRGYVNKKVVELELSGFRREEPTYTFYVSCENDFGRSDESSPHMATVLFTRTSQGTCVQISKVF